MASIATPKKFLQPKNLVEVLQNYEAEVTTETPGKAKATLHQLQTALIRYTLPGWGLPHPKTRRVSAKEIQDARTFMETISLEQLNNALEVQMSVYEQLEVPISSQRTYRHALKKLLKYCDDQNWWQSELKVERRPFKQKKDYAKDVRTTQRKRQEYYALGAVKGDAIPKALQKQLQDFEEFLSENSKQTPTSVKRALQGVYQVLGWLYRYENVPLDELGLETLIQFVPFRTAISNLSVRLELAERLLRQEELRREAMRAADATELRLRKYLSWLRTERKAHPRTEYAFLRACLNVAKFLYRFETDKHEVANYDDIPIVNRIRALIQDVTQRQRTAPSPIDINKKWLPWEDWLEVVETLRKECHQASYIGGQPRPLRIARSLQRYLMCALLTYMPPMRQQAMRNLELGHSLLWEGDRWYIRLRPNEYKTGKAYGEFCCEVSNPDFEDGTCFYDYIDAWLYDCSKLPRLDKLNLPGGLRATYEPEHNFFFTQRNREPMQQHTLSEYIRQAAYRITGKVVTPHLLRDMFVSHLIELGCSDAELNAVAIAMQHSPETQRKIYDQRIKDREGNSWWALSTTDRWK